MVGVCLCGCGEPTSVAKKNDGVYRKGEFFRYRIGHHKRLRSSQIPDGLLYDPKDARIIAGHYWGIDGSGYVATKINGKSVRLHTILVCLQRGQVTDHMNGNKLDNRRCNLRAVSPRINSYNSPVRKNSKSGVKNVYLYPAGTRGCPRNRYVVQVKYRGKIVTLGTFYDLATAASVVSKW
jgi:hypothetical protein